MQLEGKKIAFLSDSITKGIYLANLSDSYMEQLRHAVNWGAFVNHSVPGSRIGEYIGPDPKRIKGSFLERYPQMPDGMDIVVIFGGSNDFGIGNAPMGTPADRDPYTFNGAVNLLMDGIKAKYPDATIIMVIPLHRRNENVPNEFSGAVLEDYIQVLCRKATENGFLICDLRTADGLQGDELYYSMLMDDGLHPLEEGHKIIADEFLKYLKAI